MKNVNFVVEGSKLVITVDLAAARTASASGKSLVIASSEGNVSLEEHPEIKIGLNVYTPAPKGK